MHLHCIYDPSYKSEIYIFLVHSYTILLTISMAVAGAEEVGAC